jgi:hypothetical protein
MKSKRSLMLTLVGLAMLAMPLTAAAKDHQRFQRVNSAAQYNFRNGRNSTWMPVPAAVVRHENHGWKHGWNGNDGDADDYQNSGYRSRGYYAAPVYAAPAYAAPVYAAPAYGYGGGYGGVGNCRNARGVVNNYYRDRATGHPAAANDILRKNQWAFQSGCANAPVGRGLFNGLGGQGGYGGYGYRGAPANYGGYNNGYNGAYGQPYGGSSMLAPLLQYIR